MLLRIISLVSSLILGLDNAPIQWPKPPPAAPVIPIRAAKPRATGIVAGAAILAIKGSDAKAPIPAPIPRDLPTPHSLLCPLPRAGARTFKIAVLECPVGISLFRLPPLILRLLPGAVSPASRIGLPLPLTRGAFTFTLP